MDVVKQHRTANMAGMQKMQDHCFECFDFSVIQQVIHAAACSGC